MAQRQWIFFNLETHRQVILQDEASANNLKLVLKDEIAAGKWKIECKTLTPQSSMAPPPFASNRFDRGTEKRRNKRYRKRFQVYVISERQTYFSYSENISVGGIKFCDEFNGAFRPNGEIYRIVIGRESRGGNLHLKCRLTSVSGDQYRIQFIEMDPQTLLALQTWLDENAITDVQLDDAHLHRHKRPPSAA